MMPHTVRIIFNYLVILILVINEVESQEAKYNSIRIIENEIRLINDIISDQESNLISIASKCIQSLKIISKGSREGDDAAIKCKSVKINFLIS